MLPEQPATRGRSSTGTGNTHRCQRYVMYGTSFSTVTGNKYECYFTAACGENKIKNIEIE